MAGTLSWTYQPFTSSGSAKVREVATRSMNDSDQPTPVLHDSYGTSFSHRGNPTSTWQFGTTINTAYLITGVPYQMQDGAGLTVNVRTDGSTANSLPLCGHPTPTGISPAACRITPRSG
jgi:hypothetical protein